MLKIKFNYVKSLTNIPKIPFSIRNIPPNLEEKINMKLYKTNNHPLNILRNKITDFFLNEKFADERSKIKDSNQNHFVIKEDFPPIVSTQENFYDLLVEKTNETTSPKNTYYVDDNNVLRTHMTAHDLQMLRAGHKSFVTIGDVYRRDSIDSTHYPIFHQADGVRLFKVEDLRSNPYGDSHLNPTEIVSKDLQNVLQGLNKHLFGDVKFRWVDAYFPFTNPSYELEIFFNGDWLEVLGCGILRDGIVKNAGYDPEKNIAWAFGIGLERLAMKMFDIKDIRLFWTKDKRFINQFTSQEIVKFKPYSKFPACYKDISLYVNESFNDNDLFEVIRNITGDLVEEVKCVDSFVHPTTKRHSKCFRILFRHMDRNLTNEEINLFQAKIREDVKNILRLELR